MSGQIRITGMRSSGNVVMIDPTKITVVPEYNVREAFDPDSNPDDNELYMSVLANGYLADKPSVVRMVGTTVLLVVGHRRLAAVMRARANGAVIKEIACILEGPGRDGKVKTDAERFADLILSNSGKPLSAPEKGAAIIRMRVSGMKDAAIAQMLGMTDKWVRELGKLSTLDPRLKHLVSKNVISSTLAVEMTAQYGTVAAADIAEKVAKVAPKTGAKAGKVTGKGVTAVTGKAGKADAKAARKAVAKGATTQVPAVASRMSASVLPTKVLVGPFTVGKDIDDCMVFEGNGSELGEMPSAEKARAVIALLNQAWATFAGKSSEADMPAPGKTGKAKAVPAKRTVAEPLAIAPALLPARTGRKPVVITNMADIGTVIAGKANGAAKPGRVARK